MPSFSKPVSWVLQKFTPKKEEGSSFQATINALVSRARSVDITVTEAETIVEELEEVRLTLENLLACSEVSNS